MYILLIMEYWTNQYKRIHFHLEIFIWNWDCTSKILYYLFLCIEARKLSIKLSLYLFISTKLDELHSFWDFQHLLKFINLLTSCDTEILNIKYWHMSVKILWTIFQIRIAILSLVQFYGINFGFSDFESLVSLIMS